jgi:hypothetical protein
MKQAASRLLLTGRRATMKGRHLQPLRAKILPTGPRKQGFCSVELTRPGKWQAVLAFQARRHDTNIVESGCLFYVRCESS